MFDKMRQLTEMKKQADRIKKELDSVMVEVEEVPGIKIVMTGTQDFRSFEINESLLRAENKTQLEKDLLQSMNAAVKKTQSVAAQRIASMGPGF